MFTYGLQWLGKPLEGGEIWVGMRRSKRAVMERGEWRPSLFIGRLRDKKTKRL